jgi:hypothetical protein
MRAFLIRKLLSWASRLSDIRTDAGKVVIQQVDYTLKLLDRCDELGKLNRDV